MTFDSFSQVIAFIGGLCAALLGLVVILKRFAVTPLLKYLQEHLEEQINTNQKEIDILTTKLDNHITESNLRAKYATKERQLMMRYMGITIDEDENVTETAGQYKAKD